MSNTEPIMQRLVWADVTRVLAITLVILVHTFTYPPTVTWSTQLSMYIFVCAKSCVPLFLMLTGALLLSKQEPTTTYIGKRVRRVMSPWLTWTLLIFLFTSSQVLGSPQDAFRTYFGLLSSSFTYIPMIMCLYLLIPTFRIIVTEAKLTHIWFLITLWFLATSVLPFTRNTMAFPVSVDNGLVRQTIQYSGYLFLGWALARIAIRGKLFFLVLIGTLLSTLWSLYLVFGPAGLQLLYVSYSAPLIIISSAGFFLLLVNCEPYLRKLSFQTKKTLKLLSEVCFGVFLSHVLIINWINSSFFPTSSYSFGGNMSRWLFVAIVSFTLILLLATIKPLKKWIT